MLDGLRGEGSMAELCRREGIAESLYDSWSTEFPGGRQAPAGGRYGACRNQQRGPGPSPGARQLKEVVAEPALELRLLKKKHDRGWGRRGMRYPAAEQLEIIRLVEQSRLDAGAVQPRAGLPGRRDRDRVDQQHGPDAARPDGPVRAHGGGARGRAHRGAAGRRRARRALRPRWPAGSCGRVWRASWRASSCTASGPRSARRRRAPGPAPRWARRPGRWTGPRGWPSPRRAGWASRPGRWTGRPARPAGCSTAACRRLGVGGEQLLTGSSFAVTRETRRGGLLSFWSRGAQSSFAGRAGALGLDGDVRTTMVGADYATGPMIVGLSLAHSRSLGDYHSHSAQNQLRIAVSTLEDRRAAGRLHDGRRPTAICQRCNTPKASVYNAIQSLTRLVVSRKYSGIGEEKARGRPRRGYPNSAIDSTNRTRSICREIGSFL